MKVAYIFALLICGFAQVAPSFAETVKVGVALRFTPELNSFAPKLYQGIEFAKEIFEAKQEQVKVELVKYPHKAGHDSVDQAGSKIIDEKVKYVIGGEMSDEAFSLAEAFHGRPILFITPTASNPLLTAGNPLLFRACFSDDEVAKHLAEYVASTNAVIKSIGILHNTSNAYSDYLTTAFLDRLSEMSGKKAHFKIKEFRYATEAPDFKHTVEAFKNEKVDLVVAFTLQEEFKSFLGLAKNAQFNPLYLGSDGWGTHESLQKLSAFKGVRNQYWHEESKSQAIVHFKENFKKRYGREADAWNAAGFDSAWVLFQALSLAKNKSDPNEVAEVLRSTTFKDTVTSQNISFNRKNSAVKPLYLYEVSSQGTKFLKEIK